MIKMPEQVIQPTARRQRNRSWKKEPAATRDFSLAPAHLRRFIKPVGIVALLLLLVVVYKPMASSSVFDLKRVIVAGNQHISTDQAEAIVRQVIRGSVLAGDLGEVRQAFAHNPLIKDIVVARVLPDTLHVKLVEREPVAVVRQAAGRLVCVDAEGIVLGDFQLLGAQPPLRGWDDRDSALSQSNNRARLRLYAELKSVLSQMKRNYWNEVDEVDIENMHDIVLTMKQSLMTQIHLGDRDFNGRFLALRNILEDVLQGRLRTDYINAMDPDHIVVRPLEPEANPSKRSE